MYILFLFKYIYCKYYVASAEYIGLVNIDDIHLKGGDVITSSENGVLVETKGKNLELDGVGIKVNINFDSTKSSAYGI